MTVLVTFRLQPNHLNDSLKTWSPDLHDLFSYMETTKNKVKDQVKVNAQQIVEVIFNKTLHIGHFNKVQFGAMNKFLTRTNQTLSLVVLIWLHQLQEFFCDKRSLIMGIVTNMESIVLQPITGWESPHRWRT